VSRFAIDDLVRGLPAILRAAGAYPSTTDGHQRQPATAEKSAAMILEDGHAAAG
jgi:hypothetical protein